MLYLGFSILIGSLSAVAVSLLFTGLLSIYIKLVEEQELEERFGAAYLTYKKNVPFLIPTRRSTSKQ
ncbi:MAG: hypothetical protein GWN31_01895 [Candidatus Thorarchaeota archaeon]|nr:hypothetical protein [Candidatus Thorarchaeota archaeon]NIW12693.1 hypothetical protein [Candidatus Thorarchaeota archaeon]NIW50900.1 hypothetical protein [Candidatus Korarchaeota archaeon]